MRSVAEPIVTSVAAPAEGNRLYPFPFLPFSYRLYRLAN